MIISTAPIAIPVSTAHPPTESVVREVQRKVPIPESKATSENPNLRGNADPNDLPKPFDLNKTGTNADRIDGEAESKEDSKRESGQKSEQQAEQQAKDEQREQRIEGRQIAQLKRNDREVRNHEAAHAAVGGQLAGAPQLSFTTGPDGKRYAVSGEVSIDTGRVANDPQATVEKMNIVRQAALAPADPSSQDLKVAAIASQIANQALAELASINNEEAKLNNRNDSDNTRENTTEKQTEETGRASAQQRSSLLSQRIIASGALEQADSPQQLSISA